MEQIQNELEKVEKALEVIPSSQKRLPSLTPEENIILELKYHAQPIGKLAPLDQLTTCRALISKIEVITGWVITEDELKQDILADQFQKLLLEKYPSCNNEEIEHAFRAYGTTTKDWGKQMNLALIDEVMIPYMNQRTEISRLEEAHKVSRLQFKPREDTSDEAMEKWLQETKAQNMAVEFLPPLLYDWLEKTGRIKPTKREKWEQMQIAIAYTHQKLSTMFTEQMNIENRENLKRFTAMKEKGEFEPKESDQLRNLAKKMILYNYLTSL